MSVADNEALGRKFFESQDQTKGAPAKELCAPGYTAEINAFPIMDWAGHHGFAQGMFSAFPDAHHTIEEALADESRVAVRFRINGTHDGDFMGMPPTGKKFDVGAVAFLTIRDGRVTYNRAIFDQATMMQQLTS